MSIGKTVFVLGAGASCEAGLPDGNVLKKKIADALTIRLSRGAIESADDAILSALSVLAQNRENGLNALLPVARDIVANMPHQISIDNFIDMRGDRDIEVLSKLAIVRCILKGELASKLAERENGAVKRIDIEGMPDTWFGKFAQMLTVGTRKDTIFNRLGRVACVIFNYDRCFEQYLHAAFMRFYRVDEATAASFVGAIEIYHPYGQVGRLPWELMGSSPWQLMSNSAERISFGEDSLPPAKLIGVASQLRTFTEEQTQKSSELAAIRRLMSEANRIIFLGFAFHEQNMRVLFNGVDPGTNPQVFGTVFEVAAPNLGVIQGRLRSLGIHQPDLANAKCGEFLEARNRVLGFQ